MKPNTHIQASKGHRLSGGDCTCLACRIAEANNYYEGADERTRKRVMAQLEAKNKAKFTYTGKEGAGGGFCGSDGN